MGTHVFKAFDDRNYPMSLIPYALARSFLFKMDPEEAHDLTIEGLARTQNTPLDRVYRQPFVAQPITLAGKHCESGDVLLKDLALPETTTGDVVAVFATGAYNASMGSNYNRIPRPATVLVHGGMADVVQKREEPVDLLRYDVLPHRLSKLD